ncbi:MAG: polysaccharide biosynthesis protein [Acholeplasmataceae bacterium]
MQEKLFSKKAYLFIKYMFLDALILFVTYFFSMVLLDFLGLDLDMNRITRLLPVLIAYKIAVFLLFGFYNTLVEHFGFEDLIKMVLIIAFSNAFAVMIIWLLNMDYIIKSTFIFITPFEIAMLSIPRVYPRIVNYFRTNIAWGRALGKRTLVIGAGAAGEMVVKEVYRNKDLNNIPIAFVDDDILKIGNRLMGIKIIGPLKDITKFIRQMMIEEVIIAISDLPHDVEQKLLQDVSKSNVRIKKLISISDMDSKSKPIIRDINVEDLLNRDPIVLDNQGILEFISHEVVLVTGGGGSIGSELCRQIAELNPKMLIIYDIYENNAYDIQMELLRKYQKSHETMPFELKVLIGSVYNYKRLDDVFKAYKPTIVFHAAAYKHVPLMEDSPVEAVRTNVIGTQNTAKLSSLYDVKKFVLVSSDKAVRSTNIMGATKRYAELVVQCENNLGKTKFSAVRFGNVLGSNGSVIPLFKKQIDDGGPVTVTHKDITRFFMTIPEAVGLILQSAVYANGGEIFILDMGEPVRIVELAEKMIKLAGYIPYEDINIEFTGLRPGEKLFEELLVDQEIGDHKKTDNEKIYIESQNGIDQTSLNIEEMKTVYEELTDHEIKEMVAEVIGSYTINGNGLKS